MSLFDVLNSQKDAAALNTVIDHAAQTVVDKLVPALKAALIEVVDHAADRMEGIISKANAAAQDDLRVVVTDCTTILRTALTDVSAAIGKFDGATVALNLGGSKQTGGI